MYEVETTNNEHTENKKPITRVDQWAEQITTWAERMKVSYIDKNAGPRKWWQHMRYFFVLFIVWLRSITNTFVPDQRWRSTVFFGLMLLMFSVLAYGLFKILIYLVIAVVGLALVAGLVWFGYKAFEKSRAEQAARKAHQHQSGPASVSNSVPSDIASTEVTPVVAEVSTEEIIPHR
jgi:hypothetical protein